ncbi:hypothetical protein F3Y22_tig00110332pilonHSYRG01075 [Hibiscus syriacus]|uniref:RRM domain-containing protein n=1 Tax=Hibiscus syriacus TaxID=106335 RepID=A0A6A3AXM4_HIBSY|nr:hypothetical protein F3Y22_tig00110332pilonHSYRG01075 [Hibiscus syriacus]
MPFQFDIKKMQFQLILPVSSTMERVRERECKFSDGKVSEIHGGGTWSAPKYKDCKFAFVHFASKEDLCNAVEKTNNVRVDGKIISVSVAKYDKLSEMKSREGFRAGGSKRLETGELKGRRMISPAQVAEQMERMNRFLDGRTYRDTVVGVKKVLKGLQVSSQGNKKEENKSLEVFILVEERIWLKSSLTGICKDIFEVDFVQKALRNEGFKAKVIRWGFAKNACLVVFQSVEERRIAMEERWEALSFWFQLLDPVVDEGGIPLAYCAISMVGVPLNCWSVPFFSSLASRWGKLVRIQDQTAHRVDCRVAQLLRRVESPFDIPEHVIIDTYGRKFMIKIKVECVEDFFPELTDMEEKEVAEDPWEKSSSKWSNEEVQNGQEEQVGEKELSESQNRVDKWVRSSQPGIYTNTEGGLNLNIGMENTFDLCKDGTQASNVFIQQEKSEEVNEGRENGKCLGDPPNEHEKVDCGSGFLRGPVVQVRSGLDQEKERLSKDYCTTTTGFNGVQYHTSLQERSVSVSAHKNYGKTVSGSRVGRGKCKRVYSRSGRGGSRSRIGTSSEHAYNNEEVDEAEALECWNVSELLGVTFRGGKEAFMNKMIPLIKEKEVQGESKMEVVNQSVVRKMGGNLLTATAVSTAEGSAGGSCWFINMYGPSVESENEAFFGELLLFLENLDSSVCLGGDFNVVMSQEEKIGGAVNLASMFAFREFVSKVNLVDLPMVGGRFTWCNNREIPTYEILDLGIGTHSRGIDTPSNEPEIPESHRGTDSPTGGNRFPLKENYSAGKAIPEHLASKIDQGKDKRLELTSEAKVSAY